MDKQAMVKKIQKIMEEIQPVSFVDGKTKFVNIQTYINFPPSYIVKILLFKILDFNNYGPMDKVEWHTYVRYKDNVFMLRDWKRTTWTIEGVTANLSNSKLSVEIVSKIKKSSAILDKFLQLELSFQILKGDFYIRNQLNRMLGIYKFYTKLVRKELHKSKVNDKFSSSSKKTRIAKVLNPIIRRNKKISIFGLTCIVFYYSLLEFIFDLIYTFEKADPAHFFTFKKNKFKERFKEIFPIDKNKKLKSFYEELLNIKRKYRDSIVHGLTDANISLLVSSKVGLVPLSYEFLSQTVYFGLFEIDVDEVGKILNLFEDFYKWLRANLPYKFYLKYAEAGLEIPFDQSEVNKIKSYMKSEKIFSKYIKERVKEEEYLLNSY
jgi:hypothetical protein